MTPRYIDSNLAKAQFTGNFQDSYNLGEVKAMIDEVPTADVAPIRRGRWIEARLLDSNGEHLFYRCSDCGTYIEGIYFANDYNVRFCPNCGAKMDEREK